MGSGRSVLRVIRGSNGFYRRAAVAALGPTG
jgi:hypothetical protein